MDWHLYWIWLAIASVITFLLYGFDKAQSKKGGWRVPDVILHVLALSGRVSWRLGWTVGIPT